MGLFNTSSKAANPYTNKNLSAQELYEKLKNYYDTNNLYDAATQNAYYANTWIEQMKPLRDVVNRSVEFFVAKVCPTDPEVITENEAVKESVEQFFKWSNFSAQKQIAKRNLALYGDLFWKVVSQPDKVFSEIIEPKNVTSFKCDSRGYIKEIRIDVTVEENFQKKTYTEYWVKDELGGYYATWVHTQGVNTPLEQLGDPRDMATLAELGIDFIPVVHVKFRDTGNLRGTACVLHCLDKIDEANRQATRLHSLLYRYNKPTWAVLSNTMDAQGRPLPAPRVKSASVNDKENDLEIKDNSLVYLAGQATMESLIPDINYGDALAILESMMAEIREDLPELAYYSMKDSNLSGKAVKLLLASAIDRAQEANDNFLQGLKRLDEMALSIGAYLGLFKGIGSYQAGDFEHELITAEMFPMDITEKAVALQSLAAALPIDVAMRLLRFSEEEIEMALQSKAKADVEKQNNLATAFMNFNRGE